MKTDTIDDRRVGAPGQLLMTPKEAASALRISPRKLWELTDQGEIPSLRIGRCVRYRLMDLEAWVVEQLIKNEVSIGS